ncbi:glycosyltransferase [Methylobacterium oryzae CBMB20]
MILVDNASTDGTPERVAGAFPWVRVIAERTNHGFAGGNAVALEHARGAAILLLNPDAFLHDPDALSGLLDHLDAHPDVGAVGPRLTFPDGTHQVGDAGYEPRPLSILVHAAGLSGPLRAARPLPRRPPGRGARSLDVDWICGACLLLRRSAIARDRRPAEPDVPLRRGRGLGLPPARCRPARRLPPGHRRHPPPGRLGKHPLGPLARRAGRHLRPAERRPAPVVACLLLGPAPARLHPAGPGLRSRGPAARAAGPRPQGRGYAADCRAPAQSSSVVARTVTAACG